MLSSQRGRIARVVRGVSSLVLALAAARGCGGGDMSAVPPPAIECGPGEWPLADGSGCRPAGLPPDMQCPPGELALEGGGCQPAGLPPDMPCAPGETVLEDGSCQPAGVPPERCAQ